MPLHSEYCKVLSSSTSNVTFVHYFINIQIHTSAYTYQSYTCTKMIVEKQNGFGCQSQLCGLIGSPYL